MNRLQTFKTNLEIWFSDSRSAVISQALKNNQPVHRAIVDTGCVIWPSLTRLLLGTTRSALSTCGMLAACPNLQSLRSSRLDSLPCMYLCRVTHMLSTWVE
jgi:hypothetical protein